MRSEEAARTQPSFPRAVAAVVHITSISEAALFLAAFGPAMRDGNACWYGTCLFPPRSGFRGDHACN